MKKIITLSLGLLIAATCFFSIGNLANAFSPDDLCNSISSGTDGWVSCGGSGGNSFTNFDGGLQAPSEAGYDKSLTQVTSAREFIVKVVNFALGFLGLIAVVIIIYGGIRYVTSAGENDGVDKGKKSIMYAALGLVIVMGSYAIVNTLLKAPGGTDQGSSGAATMQTETQQTVVFSVEELKNIPNALINAYTTYSQNQTDLLAINQGMSQVWDTSSNFKSISDMQSALSSIEIGIQSTKNKLNEIGLRTSKYSALQDRVAQFEIYTNSWIGDKRIKSVEISKNADCINGCTDLTAFQADLAAKWSELTSYLLNNANGAPPKITAKDAKFMTISFAAMKKDNEDTFNSTIDKIKNALGDLEASTQGVAGVSDIENAFKKLGAGKNVGLMDELKNADTKSDPGLVKEKIIAIVKEIINLQKTLSSIKFVKVYLSADQIEGNAPLIVNFNTQGSEDATGQSIKDENIEWDLNGNNEFNQGEIWSNCKEQKIQNTTCIYSSPGTYRVAVKIASSDKAKIASGKAYITIKVLPPKARIKLYAYPKIGGQVKAISIMEYDAEGFLLVNKPGLQVTLTQALNGIDFDATGTTSSNTLGETGTADTIQSVRWDFGDRTDVVEGEPSANSKVTHFYKEPGDYTVKFEVTDKKGIKDRKVFVVTVSSIASLIDVLPEPVGNTGENFTFDGRSSASDNGQISRYEWTVTPSDADAVLIKDPLMTRKFVKPGLYSVSLKVADTLGNESISRQDVKIESFPPIAKFSYLNEKATQPAIFNFDASRTYDPDGPSKDITYLWAIDGDAKDYKIISGDEKSQKMTIKFDNLNTYKVTLKVADKNEPEKTTVQEKEISVTSLLDVLWADKGNTSSISLSDDSGEAQASFNAVSEHATNYDFDFGDGGTESGVPSDGKIEASHTYKKSGVFQVKIVVSDDEGNKNSLTRRIVIGGAKKPIAVIKLLVNGEEMDINNLIEVSRKDVLTFDATDSINTNGSKSGLKYQWDFGDSKKSTKDIATYTYKDLTKKPNEVSLKITSSSDATMSATDGLKISVVSVKPMAKSIIAVPESTELKTPLKVDVGMIEPSDVDGRVISYKWWYFDINNPEDRLGEQITKSPATMIVVGTRGNEGDTYTYKFAGSLTDDNNQEVLLEDLLGTDSLPTIDITNGPNKSPIAKFSADKTNVKMGESITFTSSSTDPDGNITTYIWDTDGTGFAGKEQSEKPSITVKYDKPMPEGVQVRLKVIDNNFGETVSDPITIYVTSKANPPKAAFTYTQETGTKNIMFKNNSAADTENGAVMAKYIWDFDTISSYQTADSDGDGKKNNDIDSTETNPAHSYSAYSLYYVKLTVVDSFGSETTVTNPVEVKSSAIPGSLNSGGLGINFGNAITSGNSVTNSSFVLKVVTTPETESDNKIHLLGATGVVKFDFSSSTGDIAKIVVDKNIYFDSDNNGLKDDDVNFQTTNKANYYQSSFDSAWGKTAVKITAYSKTGVQDAIIKEVVFDSLTKAGANNVFVVPGSVELYGALAGMFGFGILSAKAIKRKRSKRIKK